jgi:replication factor C small subunit
MIDIKNKVWVEKYRPQTLDEVLLNAENKTYFSALTDIENNMLFLGRSGLGKSAVAKILANKFAPNTTLYINASDKNGIDIVRNEISDFISVQSFDGNQKVVILDEVDGFSKAGQDALRAMMEEYLDDVKFILTGNYKHKVTDALKSRCQTFEFSTDFRSVMVRVVHIIKSENIKLSEDQKPHVSALVKRYFPDIRKTINELQRCCITGTFTFSDETSEFINELWKKITEKQDVFSIRKYVIDSAAAFNNDYHHIMRQLFDFYVNVGNSKALILIADHMEKDSRVKDAEVNFSALLFNLNQI